MAYSPNSFNGYGGATRSGAFNVANPSDPTNFLETTLPGYSTARDSAMSSVNNLLKGLPSVDQTRTANAYFGAQSGMPGSDFIRNRGYDLYQQKAEGNRQTGIQDLLSLISGTTGPALTNQAQQFQNSQFGQNLEQQGSQFNQNLQLQQFLAQLQALGLGNSITNSGNQTLPQLNY